MNKCGGEVKVPSIQGSQSSRRSLLAESPQASHTCPSAKNSTLMSMEHWWNYPDEEKTKLLGENPVPVPICAPQISYWLIWGRSRSSEGQKWNSVTCTAWSTACDTCGTENTSNVQSQHSIVINATIVTGHQLMQNNTVTTSTKQNHCWQADIPSNNQYIRCILRNPTLHYRVHNSLPPVSILSKINPVHALPCIYFKFHFNIILPPTLGYSNGIVPSDFPTKTLYAPLFKQLCS